MQYEDIVYNAGILAMAVRLEVFLDEWNSSPEGRKATKRSRDDKYTRLHKFVETRKESAPKGAHKRMETLFQRRDSIAHERANIGWTGFDDSRRDCAKVDGWLATLNLPPNVRLPRMSEVMVSCSLRYDMGNAGDIVKHGVLAEFARWWCKNGRELRYADPFGGRPWGWPKMDIIRNRLNAFKDSGCALWKAQKESECVKSGGLYYGSSHVVVNAAKAAGGRAAVWADDFDKIARADLKVSGLAIISDKVQRCRGRPWNGYSILDPDILQEGRFDLILLDPHADFLRKELSAKPDEGQFRKISKAIIDNPDLWVAVFVLVEGENQEEYEKRRREYFGGRGIALRCPSISAQDQPDGERHYDMEILLVSSRLESVSPPVSELRENIGKFKAAAEKALGANIDAWELKEGRK